MLTSRKVNGPDFCWFRMNFEYPFGHRQTVNQRETGNLTIHATYVRNDYSHA